MKRFKFVWLDGKEEIGEGQTVADAFTRLGYGSGARHALNYYEELQPAETNTNKQ